MVATTSTERKDCLESVQILRGIAALLVVLVHAAQRQESLGAPAELLSSFAYLGVNRRRSFLYHLGLRNGAEHAELFRDYWSRKVSATESNSDCADILDLLRCLRVCLRSSRQPDQPI